MENKKVLITGASGLIGGMTIAGLSDKYDFSGLSRRNVEGIPYLQADVAGAEAIKPAFVRIDTVLHLAAANDEDQANDWNVTMAVTAQGTLNVYEAARLANVKRVIHMSSGCAQLAYEWDDDLPYGRLANGPDDEIPSSWRMIELSDPVRPDSPYAVGKIFGETLGRYYADKYGISTITIRLGAVLPEDRPQIRHHYPGFLSQADCVQMIDKCIDAPDDLKFEIFNAISETSTAGDPLSTPRRSWAGSPAGDPRTIRCRKVVSKALDWHAGDIVRFYRGLQTLTVVLPRRPLAQLSA